MYMYDFLSLPLQLTPHTILKKECSRSSSSLSTASVVVVALLLPPTSAFRAAKRTSRKKKKKGRRERNNLQSKKTKEGIAAKAHVDLKLNWISAMPVVDSALQRRERDGQWALDAPEQAEQTQGGAKGGARHQRLS